MKASEARARLNQRLEDLKRQFEQDLTARVLDAISKGHDSFFMEKVLPEQETYMLLQGYHIKRVTDRNVTEWQIIIPQSSQTLPIATPGDVGYTGACPVPPPTPAEDDEDQVSPGSAENFHPHHPHTPE